MSYVYTMDEARAYVREWIVRIPNLDLLRSFFTCLDKGERFTSDNVTHNGKLTVVGDTRLDGPQTKIASLFTSARSKGWIETIEQTTSTAPRRRKSDLHTHDVKHKGQVAATVLLAALAEYERSLLEE